ncbi:DUF3309 family protein, partial [Acinetobacter baumannii]
MIGLSLRPPCFREPLCFSLQSAAPVFRGPPGLRESARLSTILIVLLVVALMVGLSGRLGGYGFGYGHSGMGLVGVILVVLVVLKLL